VDYQRTAVEVEERRITGSEGSTTRQSRQGGRAVLANYQVWQIPDVRPPGVLEPVLMRRGIEMALCRHEARRLALANCVDVVPMLAGRQTLEARPDLHSILHALEGCSADEPAIGTSDFSETKRRLGVSLSGPRHRDSSE
jgi:hypothetical protein